VLAASEEVAFDHEGIADGETVAVGSMQLTARATPGHTPGHLAYVLSDETGPQAVFTGGSLLFGTVGRTDLVAPARTEALTRAQFRSVRALLRDLAPTVAVLPTHGFGSFCASSPGSGASSSTIGDERAANVVAEADEDAFVATITASLGPYPRYYASMAPINRKGPPPFPRWAPRPVGPGELATRLNAGEWVVDLRPRRAFASAHLAGSVGFEHALPFTTYLGWVVPYGARLTLLGASAADVAAAARDLALIGLDDPSAAYGAIEELAAAATVPLAGYRVVDFRALGAALARHEPISVLDVRQPDEWRASHVAGAIHAFLGELPERLAELPDEPIWVYCSTGYRASVAAGILQRAGRSVTLVDDDWSRAEAAGVPLVAP